MNKIKGYRTIIFNVLMALAAVFGPLGANEAGVTAIGTEEINQAVAAVVAIGNIALRFITDTPVGASKGEG